MKKRQLLARIEILEDSLRIALPAVYERLTAIEMALSEANEQIPVTPDGFIKRLANRVRTLEAASTEPTAYQRSLEARLERIEQLVLESIEEPVTEEELESAFKWLESLGRKKSETPDVSTPPVCATCGHGAGLHIQHKSASGKLIRWACHAGPLGKPCKCTNFIPAT